MTKSDAVKVYDDDTLLENTGNEKAGSPLASAHSGSLPLAQSNSHWASQR